MCDGATRREGRSKRLTRAPCGGPSPRSVGAHDQAGSGRRYADPVTMSIVLDRLSEPGLDRQETGMRIIAALDDGATLEEIAARLGRPVQEIERVYAPAINEAGRLGQVK